MFVHHAAREYPLLEVEERRNPNDFFQVTDAPSFFDATVIMVASSSITIHRCMRFPATVSQGEPPDRKLSYVHT
ncbi:hypothetical protein ACPCK9_32065 [Streptomyces koyangensis]|uniref:hypothetical protein n=1 Tax=Streptomyces koyangensis TaxID=188770 RepID=UPI0036FBBB34